jgi:hypothetical protein
MCKARELKGTYEKYITCAVTAFFAAIAVSIAAPDKEAIKAKETAAWQAYKDKKADDFKRLVSADFQGVYSDGISNLQKELDDMQKWDLRSFTLSNYNAISVGSDTIVTTYKAVIDATVEGKDASGTFNCGSVWKMQEGRVARHFSHQCKGGGSRHAGSQPIGKGAINSREKVGCVLRFASCTTSATMAIEVLLH